MQNNIVIPQNVEAEKSLIGSILLDNQVITKVEGVLLEQDFYDNRNKIIYSSIIEMYRNGITIDITTLVSDLENKNNLTKAGGYEYLSTLADEAYSVANVDSYIAYIEESSLRRSALKLLQTLVEKGYNSKNNTFDFLEDMETSVFELSKRRKIGSFTNIKDVTSVVLETTEKMSKQKENVIGLKTGFHQLDMSTLGFQSGHLIILAARPAMGKSAMALNLAVNICSKNKNAKATCAIFSLEMPKEQLVERMIANDSKISIKDIKRGFLKQNEWIRFQTACTHLNNLNIYFSDDANVTVAKIKSVCRQLKESTGLDFVVIDYLQLINTEGTSRSTVEDVSKISRALKLMALELGIPVLALSQLSRAVEKRDDKRPIMADLRDSGSIEQDADIVMFLYRDDYYNKEHSTRKGEADLIISKNRQGNTHDGIPLIFKGEFSSFIDKLD